MAMANNMPKLYLKSKNLITFELEVQILRIASHLKATNNLYLHSKSQVHRRIIAFTVACPKQQKANLASIDV
jgi:hypothetical protein